MDLKPAPFPPRPKFVPEGFRFLRGPAMHQAVVSLATPWKVRMCLRQPEVKRIVPEEIG